MSDSKNPLLQKMATLLLGAFMLVSVSVFANEPINPADKKWIESEFSEVEINLSKDAYRRSLDSMSSLNQSIEALYSNNVKAWYAIRKLQEENQKLRNQLSTLQEAVRQINNNLFQMQQRLEVQ